MLPVALQLFSIRESMEKDTRAALGDVADMGYRGVELCGFGGITTYKLSDYTEDMAKNNLIVNSDPSFSLKYCTDLTNSVFPGLVK